MEPVIGMETLPNPKRCAIALSRINTALQRPFLFLHESARYLTARALGMAAIEPTF